MAELKKYTSDQMAKAKKMKFKTKRSKKPSAKASLNALEGYVVRYNSWVDRIKDKAKEYEQKEKDKKRKSDLLKKIRAAK